MPGASASTHGLACKWKKHTSVVATGEAVSPAFPARWFYGFLRALPGVHDLLVTVIGAMQSIVANLTPAKGRQDHTTSPSAHNIARQSMWRVHRIPRSTSVTIAKRPSYRARDGASL